MNTNDEAPLKPVRSVAELIVGSALAVGGVIVCCVIHLEGASVVVAFLAATIGAVFGPLHPYLLGVTALLLALAFYREYRPRQCKSVDGGAIATSRRTARLLLWILAAAALALVTVPYYSDWPS